MATIIVLVGLPGSGKSDYAIEYMKTHVWDNGELNMWQICSPERTRMRLSCKQRQLDTPQVFKECYNEISAALARNYNVIYDATNLTRKNRVPICELGKHHHIEAHVIWKPIDECVQEIAVRNPSAAQDTVMFACKKWQMPYYDEGFEAIHVVHNCVTHDVTTYKQTIMESLIVSQYSSRHSLNINEHCKLASEYVARYTADETLIEAARIHDCGKPLTRTFKENSSDASYYDHHSVGGYLCLGMYLTTDPALVDIAWLVSSHMEPYFKNSWYKNIPEKYQRKIELLHAGDRFAH